MTAPEGQELPSRTSYALEEALGLLAALEDARDALTQGRQLVLAVDLEKAIERLSRN